MLIQALKKQKTGSKRATMSNAAFKRQMGEHGRGQCGALALLKGSLLQKAENEK